MVKYRRFVKMEKNEDDSLFNLANNEQPAADQVEKYGVLYLCATPIGNLEDITFRVLRILKEVDLVAAEDTRRTRGLLSHYGISKPLTSYYQHNQRQKGPYLIEQLIRGQSVALVSDAGTPGISDPGEELVQQALAAGISVFALPGPSVVPVALSISGLSTKRFVFEGFLPRSRRGKSERIQELSGESGTLVLFEAPHRLLETLSLVLEAWGPRRAAIVREATKKFEEVVRGTLPEIIDHFQVNLPRGEMTLVIEGNSQSGGFNSGSKPEANPRSVAEVIDEVMREVSSRVESGGNPKYILKEIAREKKLNRRDLYQAWIKTQQSNKLATD